MKRSNLLHRFLARTPDASVPGAPPSRPLVGMACGDAACAATGALTILTGAAPSQVAAGATAAVAAAGWVLALLTVQAYDGHLVRARGDHWRRVIRASVVLLAFVGTLSWATSAELAPRPTLLAVAATLGGTLAQREVWLTWYRRRRPLPRVILVGHHSGVATLLAQLSPDAAAAARVVGCCLPATDRVQPTFAGVPVLGRLDNVHDVVRTGVADAVAVMPCPELQGRRLRRLGHQLADQGVELFLASPALDADGAQVRVRSTPGLPLMRVERRESHSLSQLVTAVIERTVAALALVLLLPLLLVIAAGIKATSRGPVLVGQPRTGRSGRAITALRFRTRLIARSAGARPGSLPKVAALRAERPRSRVGAVLERHHLAELPQLLNVLQGDLVFGAAESQDPRRPQAGRRA
jgi:Bacterial sugar transferase/CoA-binding domain